MRIVCWGTYDLGKPRNRILLRGLKEAGAEVVEIHADIWKGIDDKGDVAGTGRKLLLMLKWLAAYPALLWRYMRASRHDAVLVGYMGQLDVLVLWPFAKLRGVPVVWDVFLSLYNTVVEDRRIVSPFNPLAWLLFAWEWLACRAASQLIMDTRTHADYLADLYGLKPGSVGAVFVGVEPEAFPPCQKKNPADPGKEINVLFYGQFIPLHGIETIIRAAQAAVGEPIRWTLIGRGQEAGSIRHLLADAPAKVEWIEWVRYEALRDHIAQADVCLGIFGDTDKAARVIPNKVFQILSSGKPLVTRDSPAIRELLSPETDGVYLVPPTDPGALLDGVRSVHQSSLLARPQRDETLEASRPRAIGVKTLALLDEIVGP
jgi:glycosyltransferase involved in cell wall biosynthesis